MEYQIINSLSCMNAFLQYGFVQADGGDGFVLHETGAVSGGMGLLL